MSIQVLKCANPYCDGVLPKMPTSTKSLSRFCIKCRMSTEPLKISCLGCGQPASIHYPGTLYCSNACKQKNARVGKRRPFWWRENAKQILCVRCGRDVPIIWQKRSELCPDCKMIIIDRFKNGVCVYCNSPSGQKKYCSQKCLQKTFALARRMKK